MNNHSFSELSESISMCIDKEKDKLLCNRLLNICKELNISGYYSDKYIHFNTQDKIQVGKLQLGKSKVTMIFYNKSRGECPVGRLTFQAYGRLRGTSIQFKWGTCYNDIK